jgi:hypothetical protein
MVIYGVFLYKGRDSRLREHFSIFSLRLRGFLVRFIVRRLSEFFFLFTRAFLLFQGKSEQKLCNI